MCIPNQHICICDVDIYLSTQHPKQQHHQQKQIMMIKTKEDEEKSNMHTKNSRNPFSIIFD